LTNRKNSTLRLNEVLDQSYHLLQQEMFKEGYTHLVSQLDKLTRDLPQSTIDTTIREECLQHPLAKVFLQEPITKHSYQKPRGYSGDAVLIDYLYGLKAYPASISYVGRELHHQLSNAGSSRAVRWRVHHIASLISSASEKANQKIDIFSVASGHLRELAYLEDAESKINRLVCLDQDDQCNEEVRANYNHHAFLEIIDQSINHVLKRKMEGQAFNLVYSTGLFDYLNDKVASRMLEILYGNLKPGGTMIIPNFLKGIPEKAYMETFMKWNLIYRDEEDMVRLCAPLNLPVHKIKLYRDPMERVVYLKIEKPRS